MAVSNNAYISINPHWFIPPQSAEAVEMDAQLSLYGCDTTKKNKIIVFGACSDGGTPTSKRGSASGPDAIRIATAPKDLRIRERSAFCVFLNHAVVELDIELLTDIGNLPNKPELGHQHYLSKVEETTDLIRRDGRKFLMLGGDHSMTVGAIRGLSLSTNPLTLIHFDAHQDVGYDPTDPIDHANFISHLLLDGLVSKVYQIGIRGLTPVRPTTDDQIQILSSPGDLEQLNLQGPVYLTIDTDALDPAYAPGVSYATPMGLTPREFSDYLEVLARLNLEVVGADWVEYNPKFDGSSCITAGTIAALLPRVIECLTGN